MILPIFLTTQGRPRFIFPSPTSPLRRTQEISSSLSSLHFPLYSFFMKTFAEFGKEDLVAVVQALFNQLKSCRFDFLRRTTSVFLLVIKTFVSSILDL